MRGINLSSPEFVLGASTRRALVVSEMPSVSVRSGIRTSRPFNQEEVAIIVISAEKGLTQIHEKIPANGQVLSKDYGTKPPPHDLKSQCHCERSEAIFARKQRLLRHLPLLAMTAPPSRFFSVAKVLSHGPKRLTRKAPSFSRSCVMHDLLIGLYMNRVEFGRAV